MDAATAATRPGRSTTAKKISIVRCAPSIVSVRSYGARGAIVTIFSCDSQRTVARKIGSGGGADSAWLL